MAISIPVLREVTDANSLLADRLRARFAQQGVLVLNIIASPGAGKTALVERTIQAVRNELHILVIEGDPAGTLDAQRIAAAGVPVVQINTDGGCHLEARQIQRALECQDSAGADIVIIENVGNLLCPAEWDLAEDARVVVLSLPEGDDKPLKYPMALLSAHAVVINKIDLEPHTPAKVTVLRDNALQVNSNLAVFEVSCITGQGIEEWVEWVQEQLTRKRLRSGRESGYA
jgi:hydrogenase nickel incorporation protein HypB